MIVKRDLKTEPHIVIFLIFSQILYILWRENTLGGWRCAFSSGVMFDWCFYAKCHTTISRSVSSSNQNETFYIWWGLCKQNCSVGPNVLHWAEKEVEDGPSEVRVHGAQWSSIAETVPQCERRGGDVCGRVEGFVQRAVVADGHVGDIPPCAKRLAVQEVVGIVSTVATMTTVQELPVNDS